MRPKDDHGALGAPPLHLPNWKYIALFFRTWPGQIDQKPNSLKNKVAGGQIGSLWGTQP